MEISDIENVLNQIGQYYVGIRKDCLIDCANLLDIHEVTIAEKNCIKNCFKKVAYAKEHFQNLATSQLKKVNNLNNFSIYSKI
jgi:hypothetical protein